MLGMKDKTKNEIIDVLESFNSGRLDARITPKSNSVDAAIASSLNTILDEYLHLKNEASKTIIVDEKSMSGDSANDELVSEVLTLIDAAVDGKLDARANLDGHDGSSREILKGVNELLDAVIGPLNVSAEYIDRISKGDIPEKITDTYKGDFNEIKNNLNMCIDSINALVDDSVMLAQAGIEGRLDTRANSSKHNGDFRKVIEGVNGCLDAVIGPLNVAAEYVDRISKGDIPAKITDSYSGDFNEIKNNLNLCIDSMNSLLEEAELLTDAAIAGKLTVRADTSKFSGDYAHLVQGMNDVVNTLEGHINSIPVPFMIIDRDYNVSYVNEKAAEAASIGKIDMLGTKCYDHYKTNVCKTDNCVCTRSMITKETEHGTAVADLGSDVHINCSGVPLKDRNGDIIGSLEIFMDQTEVVNAIEDAKSKVDLLNNIPTPVMAVEKDFTVKFMNPAAASAVGKTVDGCMGAKCYDLFNTPHCKSEKCQVAKAMKTGDVCTDDTHAMLPSGKLPIRYTGTALKDSNGNVIGGLEYVLDISTEVGVTEEVLKLADAAVNGKLDIRADAGKFHGNCQEIVQGVNETLDAVISPLNVSAEYIDRISKGDIPAKITDEYKGDFNEIKNNLNCLIDELNMFVEGMSQMNHEHDLGDIDVVMDEGKFQGAYYDMAKGVNDMVNGHISVKKKAMACVAEFSKGNYDAELEQFPGKKAFINDTIEELRGNVQRFIKEMQYMSAQHDLGDIDVVIPLNEFQGAYYNMAKGVNDMANGHIAVKKKAMACVKEFGEGNFEAELEQFPGKKAFINDTIEQVRSNLKALISDTDDLIVAALEGKLSTRADASKHDGDFKKIVTGINETLDAVITPLDEASRVINDFADGKLSSRFTIESKGDFKELSDTLNEFGGQLQQMINDSGDVLSSIANNDLSRRIKVNGMGEFNQLTTGIENCRISLNEIVDVVKINAEQLASSAQEISSSTEEMTAGAEQISTTVNEISTGTHSQSIKTEEVARAMQDMTLTVQEVASNSQMASENAVDSNNLIKNLGSMSSELITKMESIKNAVSDTSVAIEELDDKSKEIGEIVTLITSIADQTNLLALNAAIEAARAGEHGRGFAVVADEVRKLAEDSGNAAKQIEVLISHMQRGTQNAVSSMKVGIEEVDNGAQALETSVSAIEKVVDAGDNIANMVQEIAAAAEEQSASIEEVTSSVEEVSAVAEQSAAGTQEASASIEEQTASMHELTRSAEELANVAADMQSVVVKFKLDQNGFSSVSRKQSNKPADDQSLNLNEILL